MLAEDETGILSLLVVLSKEVKTPLLQGFEGRYWNMR
jgi:hypothetical protein